MIHVCSSARWLARKTRVTLSTNRKQDQHKSNRDLHRRISPRLASAKCSASLSDWPNTLFASVVIVGITYFVSLTTLNWKAFKNLTLTTCFSFRWLHTGLKLNLFIEQSQYIPELSHTAGARVVIHDQGQIPFPNNEGYSVLPSHSTSFAIRRVRGWIIKTLNLRNRIMERVNCRGCTQQICNRLFRLEIKN